MIGLLQSDIFRLFPSSSSMLKSLQRFLYDFIMLIPSKIFERFDSFYMSTCLCIYIYIYAREHTNNKKPSKLHKHIPVSSILLTITRCSEGEVLSTGTPHS